MTRLLVALIVLLTGCAPSDHDLLAGPKYAETGRYSATSTSPEALVYEP